MESKRNNTATISYSPGRNMGEIIKIFGKIIKTIGVSKKVISDTEIQDDLQKFFKTELEIKLNV